MLMYVKFHHDRALPSWKTNLNLMVNISVTDGRTDGQTDGQTDPNTIYPPTDVGWV